MYTIIKMVSDKRQTSLWSKIKAWFLRQPIPQEPFLELSYDPSSGYLFFADNNKEQPIKKDLMRALLLLADIEERYKVFGITFTQVENNIITFLEKTSNNLFEDSMILGTEPLDRSFLLEIMDHYFTDDKVSLERVTNVLSTILAKETFKVF